MTISTGPCNVLNVMITIKPREKGRTQLKKLYLFISLMALSVMLAACQDAKEGTTANNNAAEAEESEVQVTEVQESGEITIEGLGDHYHTGDTIELAAILSENVDYDHWQWYIKESEQMEWEAVSGQESETYTGEATTDGLEIKAALYDDNHEVYAESEPVTIVIDDHLSHDHEHAQDPETQKIYEGYFEESQVEDRPLSDWEGDWQSVYPYLEDGTLDEVFAHKAEHNGDKTKEEYKEHYNTAYQTEVNRIVIDGNQITFFENGNEKSGEYVSDGYEILQKNEGKKGVRYVFKLNEDVEGLPKYIQFSDHSIFPSKSYHFHLYSGDNREELTNEKTHWPTYYPSELNGDEIVHEMIAH